MVALNEDWSGLALNDDVTDSSDWAYTGGSAGAATVTADGFDAGVRTAAWESTTASGSFMTTWTNQAVVYVSFYWRHAVNSGSGVVYIAKISPNAGGAGAELRISSGKFQIRNNFTSVDVSALDATPDTWYRFDWAVSQTAGTQTLDIYVGSNLHGAVPDEPMSGAYSQGNVGRLSFGSVANPDSVVVSSRYSYIGVADSAFTDPYVGGGKLDTPTNFQFARVAGLRQITASATAVDGADSYDLEVQYLSGANPGDESDWTALDVFNSATPSWTLDSTDGLEWAETYRGRVVAKVPV